jgi:hypothetical protein
VLITAVALLISPSQKNWSRGVPFWAKALANKSELAKNNENMLLMRISQTLMLAR